MSKQELHPKEYRDVVFSDEAAKYAFLTKSTAKSDDTITWTDGKEYPLIKVQISSASHPFFTGEEKIIDTEGRVDRFKARAEKAKALREALANKAKKAAKEAEKKAETVAEAVSEKVEAAAEAVSEKVEAVKAKVEEAKSDDSDKTEE